MNTARSPIEEVLEAGYDCTFRELGYVDATRFLRQLGAAHGNYTEERHQWLDELSLDELLEEARRLEADGTFPPVPTPRTPTPTRAR